MAETQQLTVNVDEAVALQKEAAWAKMGRAIYISELELQAIAQNAILKIKLPTTIEDVVAAEAQLKELKKTQALLSENRKEITTPLANKAKDLMQSEASLEPHIKALNDACIAIKKADEEKKRIEKLKADEVKSLRESLTKQLAQVEEACKTKILNQVTKAYEWALTNKVKPDAIPDYVNKCSEKLTVFDFTATPTPTITTQIPKNEFDAIVKELWTLNADLHLGNFKTELKAKFQNYAIEFNNAEAALANSIKESSTKQAEITEESQNKQVAATLESTATILTTPEVRALKKAYQLEMEETEVNAHKIMQAYYANLGLCRPKMQVKNWFNFGVKNVITALEKVKNDDNNFSPAGIIFKEIDKL